MPYQRTFFGEPVVPHFNGNAAAKQVNERRRRFAGRVRPSFGHERWHPSPRAAGEGEYAFGVAGQGVE